MAEEIGLVPSQRLKTRLNSHLVFQDEALSFNCGLSLQRRVQNWNGNGATTMWSGDGLEEDDDEEEYEVDDDDEVDEGDVEVEGLVGANDNNKVNCSNNTSGNIIRGSSREMIIRDSGIVQQTVSRSRSEIHHHQGRIGNYQNAITVGSDGSGRGQKDMGGDNGCWFSGRKDVSYSNELGESLKLLRSALMDDAMILPCGHSFGRGGIQHVIRMTSDDCKRSYTSSKYNPGQVQTFFNRENTRRQTPLTPPENHIISQSSYQTYCTLISEKCFVLCCRWGLYLLIYNILIRKKTLINSFRPLLTFATLNDHFMLGFKPI
ncbi:hypothetical protein UlMin_016044 [Ulmus minor]